MSIVSVKNDAVTRTSVINASIPLAPVINSINVLIESAIADDTAVDIAGGQTVQINGTGFISGAIITLGGSAVTTVYVNANTLTFTAPAKTAATYAIYVLNPDGGTAIYIPGLVYSGTPVWTTTAISPASQYETNSIATGVLVTTGGDAPIVYTLASGTLPAGAVLNSSTGELTGTAPAAASNTTYTFTIKATDAQLQDTTSASFSLTINTDVVTMANTSVSLEQNTASNTTLTATSAAGKAISYSSTALPAGLSIVGAAVTGTPTVVGSTATTFTATAATTGRTGTGTITWTVSVAADQYMMYNTLLLSGSASTETFITDASTNNFALAIAGDTKPNNFNPYTPGYYSNYFDGTGDYLSVAAGNAALAFGTGDFTVEFWVYPVVFGPVASTAPTMVAIHDGANSTGWQLYLSDGQIGIRTHYNNVMYLTASMASYLGVWTHIAYVRSSGTQKIYMNGVEKCSTSSVWNWTDTTLKIASQAQEFNGYFSNVRLVKGTALYTSAFTPPTAPLTAISGTSVLTCQSNRFIDNSTNAFTIIVAGNTTINPRTPFVPNTAYAAYGSTYFNGTGDYLLTPSSSQFNLTGDFTIECWIYKNNHLVDGNGIFGIGTQDPDSSLVRINTGVLQFWLGGSNSGGPGTGTKTGIITCATAISSYRWYHVALVRSGSSANNVKLYLNGVLDGQGTGTYQVPTGYFVIGRDYPTYSAEYFPGYISNLRVVKGTAVYTAAFTPPTAPLTAVTGTSLLTCQTNQPVNNNVFLDNSTNAFAVTRTGNTSAGTSSPYGANWSNYFDGSDGLVPAAGLSAAMGTGFAGNIISFELWIYPTSFTNGADANGIMGAYAAVAANGRWVVIIERSATTTAKFSLTYTTGTGTSITVESTASAITMNQWNHIAITVDATTAASSTIKLFANGVLLNTFTGQNMSTQTTYYRQVYIGDVQSQYVSPMIGYISNFRILKGAFAYTANYIVPTTPLTATANTVFLTCQSNGLVDNSTNAFAISKSGDTSVQRFSPFSPQTQTPITHSAYFDGSGDYLTVPSNAAFGFGTGDFTIECWIYRTDTGGQNRGIIDSQAGAGTRIFFYLTAGGNLSMFDGTSVWLTSTNAVVANQWSHVAAVRISGTTKLFINGAQEASGADSRSYAAAVTYIGRFYGSNNDFLGYISNARIVKGVAVYTAAFTPPTAPLTATQSSGTNIAAITGTQTSLLTLQSPTFVDNSTNNFTLTAFDNVKPRTVNPFGFTSLTAAYSAATYGASAYFDSSGDYLNVAGDGSSVNFGTLDFTIEVWCYHTNGISFFDTCPAGNPTPTNRIQLQVSGDGTITYRTYQGTTTLITSSAGAVPIQQWVHLALVKYSNQTKLYVNGTQVGSTYSDTLNYPAQTNRPLLNANGYDNSAGTSAGYLSNLRIVKGVAVYTSNFVPPAAPLTAITNTSLLLNMTSAGIYDSASMNDLETVADAKRVSTHTPYAGSYYSNYFDGAGDYLTSPSNSALTFGTGDLTLECWIYQTATSTSTYRVIFADNVYGSAGGYTLYSYNNALNLWKGGSSGVEVIAPAGTITLNTWTHVAWTRSGSSNRLFINGTQVGSTTTDATNYTSTTSYIGASQLGTLPFAGYISNARIVKGTAVYTANFTPSTTPLTAIAGTSLLTCQSNRFVDNSSNLFAITRNGDTSVQSFNPFQRNSGTSLYFDGTGDYLSLPTLNVNNLSKFLTSNFTVECWIYPTTVSGDATIICAVSSWGAGANYNIELRAGVLHVQIGNGITLTSGTTSISANTWTHIALVRSSTTSTTFYVNGVSVATTATNWTADEDCLLAIGCFHNGTGAFSQSWQGYINDLRITKGIARYTSTFTPPTAAFIAR